MRTMEAVNAMLAAVTQAQANLSCKTDSDCILAPNSSACWLSCGVEVNQAGAAMLQSAISEIDATVCAPFAADGCEQNAAPPCVGGGAYCVAGQCRDFPGPSASDAGGD
jgi:hypothetical protein